MPDDYELTAGKLQNCVAFDQVCSILSSGNSIIANKMILDCLIEKMKYRTDLLDLCDALDHIATSEAMKTVINQMRTGKECSLCISH